MVGDASFSSVESPPDYVEGIDLIQGNHATAPAKKIVQSSSSSSSEAPLSVARTPDLDPTLTDGSQDLLSATETTTSVSFGDIAEG
mmetsp:Transcript_9218/g.13806  ORF Transcript_9218/g.13806 Transcript_9218/m.13806 type:complete len:86 (+) Transcript_9218:100-357(+)